jgi:hypothetical protein
VETGGPAVTTRRALTCEAAPTGKRGAYHPVPVNFEALIPASLKRAMEFQSTRSDIKGFPPLTDNLSKMRNRYLAAGARPDNTRYGWVRSRS